MIVLLGALYFALCCYDAWVTRKRLLRWGTGLEANEIVKNLSTKLGPEAGVYVGVLLPSVLITLVLVGYNLPLLLAGLIGYRLRTATIQIQSEKFVQEIDKFRSSRRGDNPPSP